MADIQSSRTIEGGLCALLAGMVGQYLGFVALRLFQLFQDVLIASVSHQPRNFAGAPASFVLVPPAHTWPVAAVAGVVIGIVAYWIHTSTADAHIRAVRRRWFNGIVLVAVVLVGRGMDFVADWGILMRALGDIVEMGVALWVTWVLITLAEGVLRRQLG